MIKRNIDKIYKFLNIIFFMIFKKEMSKTTFRQFIKHYFVGFLGSSTNYILFNVLKYLGIDTKIANFVTYLIVLVESFTLQKFFTYKPDNNSIRQPLLFLINSIAYFLIDTTILVVLIDKFMISPLISKLISIILLSPLSFVFQKFLVFKSEVKK